MLITYQHDNEVLVTTAKREANFLTEWFGPEMGRELAEYLRIEHVARSGIEINSHLTV